MYINKQSKEITETEKKGLLDLTVRNVNEKTLRKYKLKVLL